jgi:hypothetical protein
MRTWLNKWLCRIKVPADGNSDIIVEQMRTWWTLYGVNGGHRLPEGQLHKLSDDELDLVTAAYVNLRDRTAAELEGGRSRRFGPTASAKICFFVRPETVTPWDKKISEHTRGDFREHLRVCRGWAQALVREGSELGLAPSEIGPNLGRPLSTVAKLIDEWLYMTITQGVVVSG